VTNLGLVSIKSAFGYYLQGYTPDKDHGEVHASNPGRNEEETWFLIEISAAQHIYALQNWRSGRYLTKMDGPCVRAFSTVLGPTEQWKFISGEPFNILNAVAIESMADQTVIGTNDKNINSPCGGEVWAPGAAVPQPYSSWPGWWVMEKVERPMPGSDFWNTVGATFNGILVNINPADILAIGTAIAAV
jgi:Fascin domain